jgi:aldose 1-epimerase
VLSAGSILQSHRVRTASLGRHGPLADRNFGDHPHAIHGIGWQHAWEVAAVGPASATLTLRHDATGEQVRAWPFAFAAEQRFMLTPAALHVALTLRNLHRSAAPAGHGLHPYIPRNGNPTLRFNTTRVWLNGANSLPSEPVPVPHESNHSGAQRIGSVSLDNCFAGWDGKAHIVRASDGPALRIEADAPFRHLIVYPPPGPDFFCIEPVSHMYDAINRMAASPTTADPGTRGDVAGLGDVRSCNRRMSNGN